MTQSRLLSSVLALALLVVTVLTARLLHTHYPMQQWLAFRYAGIALVALVWAGACVAFGLQVLRWFRISALFVLERFALAFGLGLVAFSWLMFLVGLAGGLGTLSFLLVPGVLLASSAKTVLRLWRRLYRHLPALRRPSEIALRLRHLFLLGAGLIGLGFLYTMILNPENVHYDSRWYHMALAEHYVAAGGVERFAEGWFLGAYPQLATLNYTWAMLLPGATLFDQIVLAGHQEFGVVLGSLGAIVALVRRVLRERVPMAWVGLFLFPGVFLYGSGLHVSADHFAELFGCLSYLALLLCWRHLGRARVFLCASMLAGALLTKYTAISVAAFPIVVLIGRCLWIGVGLGRLERRAGVTALVVAAVAGLCLTSSHWLKKLDLVR